jgi:lipopolysaccharide transport system ATP-binding protein
LAEVKLDGVWVEFPIRKLGQQDTFAALKGITLSLKSGDRLGVLGRNGSGKTTLLRVLTGIYPPTKGTYCSVGSVGSMLDLSAGINGKISGRENILYRSNLLGRSKQIANETVEDACEFGELADFIDQPVENYSSGMRMRLAFSIATAVPFEILVMDEWLSVGDESFQAKAKERLTGMIDQADILVLASHNKNLLTSTCNQFLRLDNGSSSKLKHI